MRASMLGGEACSGADQVGKHVGHAGVLACSASSNGTRRLSVPCSTSSSGTSPLTSVMQHEQQRYLAAYERHAAQAAATLTAQEVMQRKQQRHSLDDEEPEVDGRHEGGDQGDEHEGLRG